MRGKPLLTVCRGLPSGLLREERVPRRRPRPKSPQPIIIHSPDGQKIRIPQIRSACAATLPTSMEPPTKLSQEFNLLLTAIRELYLIDVRPDLAGHFSPESIHAAGEIFERYLLKGGNSDRLRQCLRLFNRKPGKAKPVPPRTSKARLRACVQALQDVLNMSLIPAKDRHTFTDALRTAVRLHSSPDQEQQELPCRGRPRGATWTSLHVAVLVEEFRQRFGRSNYKDILTLVRTLAPEEFGKGITPDHLRQRCMAVSRDEVIRRHNQLFA